MAFTRVAGVQFGVPALTLTTANALGSSRTAIETDADILAFDAVAPANVTPFSAPAVGSAVVAARRDHDHNAVNHARWFAFIRLQGH